MAVKITDLIDQGEIDKLKNLDEQLKAVLDSYTRLAMDVARGMNFRVDGIEDLERAQQALAERTRQAADQQRQLTQVVEQQRQAVANTTNTISRRLMEQERLNKAQREEYTGTDKVRQLIERFHDTYDGQLQRLVAIERELKENAQAQKENAQALKEGRVTAEQYQKAQMQLVASARQLKQEKAMLNQLMTAEEKANMNVETSYAHMSQQLELLKKAYKGLSAEARESDYGKELEHTIQELDAHLKDLAADQGEFQRNVGNYAIACQNGVASTEDLNRVLGMQSATIEGCIEQSRALERAKTQLDTSDENYTSTVEAINKKLAENKERIMDVRDVMERLPRNVQEAEEQNRRLSAALKLVDVNAEGAADTIRLYRERIEQNNEMIESVTGSNEEYADSLLSIIGINADFGSSLQSLANSGGHSFIDGLTTKVKAFGQTLMGLLANPWVLAFLGIAAVGSAVKWWYDYNKGLVEATKLTQDFTGLAGDELKQVRNEVQAVGDTYGKDFQEVLIAANAMSKQFGISVQESLKLIEDGFVAGADANGEFLENVKEYPAYFREAGISASEFIAITTQANQAGIYSDKGIDVIKEGNLRIREMTSATKEALEGIGISSEEVMKGLADGSMTTFDVMKKVSEQLAQLPESSAAVGTAIADIFGGPGEDAGLQYILTLKDIDTNLDNVKDKAGELGKLQEQQMRSEIELQNAISSVFDLTGGTFEELTTKAKVFINEGLTEVINGLKGISEWVQDLYRNSMLIRSAVQGFMLQFKYAWAVLKAGFMIIKDQIVGIANALKGLFTFDWETAEAGLKQFSGAVAKNFGTLVNDVIEDTKDAWAEIGKEFEPIEVENTVTTTQKTKDESGKAVATTTGNPTGDGKDAEKAAQEELKRQQQIQDLRLALMADGHAKEQEQIRLNYQRKIDAITGNSESEKELRLLLAQQMEQGLAESEAKYQAQLAKTNLDNRLATVEEGSRAELDLKLAKLEQQRQEEIRNAEQTGADVVAINEKYDKQRLDLIDDFNDKLAQKRQKQYEDEQQDRDLALAQELLDLKKRYAEQLQEVGSNERKRNELKEQYEKDAARITQDYAIQSAQVYVEYLEKILEAEDLSADERERIAKELAQARIDLENKVTDEIVENTDKQKKTAKEWWDEMTPEDKAREILDRVSELFGSIADLMNTLFDARIENIEAEQEANEEAGEAEQERISELVEKKVITEEEGEARKRAAEAKTAKKNEELEKKKQQLKYKQAVWDKVNSVAQCGIQTALAIMNAWATAPWPVNVAMAAMAGVVGAIQTATILATPIPKYAKGTEHHEGGLAIVGDGGVPELVVVDDKAWVTPKKPTLVDLPEGAQVLPNLNDVSGLLKGQPTTSTNAPVIINDYTSLEGRVDKMSAKMDEFITAVKRQTAMQRKAANAAEFRQYIARKL